MLYYMKFNFKSINVDNLFALNFLNSQNLNYEIHQLVSNLKNEDSNKKRILWRIENENIKNSYLLVQTNFQPNIEKIKNHINFNKIIKDEVNLKVLNFNPKYDDNFIFKIRANPTKNIVEKVINGKKLHKRIPITGTVRNKDNNYINDVQKWLINKSEKNGFSILNFEYLIENTLKLNVVKNKILSAHYNSILYSGKLKVSDPNLFKLAIENGIGSAKMLGFGLLSIKRS